MNTRVLHVSDTHLGKRQYKSDVRREDFAKAFDAAIDIAIEEDVDAVIHTGDLFDDSQPNSEAISDAFSTVKRLDDEGIPFLGIVGNHERKWNKQWLDIIANLDCVTRLSTDPYVVNDTLAIYGFDSVRDIEWDNKDFNVTEPDDKHQTLVCLHELFEDVKVPSEQTDRLLETVLERMNINPDGVALGDYHAPREQSVDNVTACYAGATENTSATQQRVTVRFWDASEDTLTTTTRGFKNHDDIPRPFEPIDIELTEQTRRSDIIESIRERFRGHNAEVSESVVVINLDGSSDSPISPSDAYDVMQEMGVLVPHVNDRRNTVELDIGSRDIADPDAIDMDSLIDDEIGDVSDTVREIEDIVRDTSVPNSELRTRVEEILEDGGEN